MDALRQSESFLLRRIQRRAAVSFVIAVALMVVGFALVVIG